MRRRPEPELMSELEQARAYAEADFSEPNAHFIKLLQELTSAPIDAAQAVDLGCGPADIVARFLTAYPQAHCDAIDGSEAMLAHARAALDAWPGISKRCRLICDRLPSNRLASRGYDLILSNSLLHHLHDPHVLWRTVREVARPGAQILIMDLMRPASAGMAEALVETYAAKTPEVLRRDFRNSLFAAFEPTEVLEQLTEVHLTTLKVAVVSDRHLAVHGRLPT